MPRPLPFSHLALLLAASRLAALLLYRPGGVIEPIVTSPFYFLLNYFPAAPPMLAPLLGGLLMLPFELVTLYAIVLLTRRAGQPKEGERRALWWALSPLSLWAYLTGYAPLYTALLLALLLLLRQGRRTWLLVSLFLLAATVAEGAVVTYTALLLPLLILLMPAPAPASALFAAGALLATPFAEIAGVEGDARQFFQALYWLGAAPFIAELALMIFPLMRWTQWRAWFARAAALAFALAVCVALFGVLPADVRARRMESSPLAPALREISAAPDGWLLSDSHDLWEQAVGLGAGQLQSRVVTPRNQESVRTALAQTATPLWILQSDAEGSAALLEPVVTGFFIGDVTPLSDNTLLRRFVSAAPDARMIPLQQDFADGVTLVEARLPASAQAGSLLPIELYWTGDPATAQLFLHVLSADGTLVAQRDTTPRSTSDRYAISLPATLPAGTYTLIGGRYDSATLERLPLSQGGDTIAIATFEITHAPPTP